MIGPRIVAKAHMMRAAVIGSAAAAALLVPAAAHADTLHLADGQIVKGVVESINPHSVRFQSARVGPVEIAFAAVARLEMDADVSLITHGGERLIGHLIVQDGRAELASRLGSVSIALGQIAEIVPVKPAEIRPAEREETPRNSATVSLSYLSNQTTGFFGESRSGLLSLDLQYERRVAKGTAIGVRLPVFAQRSTTALFEGNERHKNLGIGDASISVSQDVRLSRGMPQLRLSLRGGFPTGQSAGPDEVAAVGLTSGKWSIGAEIGANMSIGSDALIASIGHERYWAAKGNMKGRSTSWTFGYAASIDQSKQLLLSVNGASVRDDGELSTPAYGSVSLVQAVSDDVTISPTISHGLNNDAADFLLAIAVTKTW